MRARSSLFAAAFCAALVAGPCLAQQTAGKFEGGVAWGRAFRGTFARGSNDEFDREVQADTAILSGVRLAYNTSDRLSIELLAERYDTLFVETAEGGLFPSQPRAGSLQMRFIEVGPRWALARGRFVPYAGFGVGLAVLDPDVPEHPEVRDSTRFSTHLDFGVKAYAFPWLGLRIDVRPRFIYLGARRLGEDSGSFDSGRWFKNIDGDAGLFLAF
ncbi:MAG TPA: hypothetical protein VGR00_13475 [Thermoanaerobaculia bacterium]|nr:hypothetical protein [Thermoanaerobaculia bacterium]